MTLDQLLREGRRTLADPGEARILLTDTLGLSRTTLISDGGRNLDASQVARYRAALERRVAGEPVAYITGQRGFWTLDLAVNPNTLIPRPETEMLVELSLAHGTPGENLRVLDLCTGSGAVALAIASERPNWSVTGTDISPEAVKTARENAETLGLHNVRFLAGDLFTPVAESRFHIITANPPYILADDPHLHQGDLRFEPRLALAAGDDGLDILRPLIEQSPGHLEPGGRLLVEHGYDQRRAVLTLAEATVLRNVRDLDDLAGQPRILSAEM